MKSPKAGENILRNIEMREGFERKLNTRTEEYILEDKRREGMIF